MLIVKNVNKSFGGVQANRDVDLQVKKNEIVGIIGPNGSGKTTLFNSIVGKHPIDSGEIYFKDREISKMTVPQISRLGMLRTFQLTHVYDKLSAKENLIISGKSSKSGLASIFSKIEKDAYEKADNLLDFVGLYGKRDLLAGELSFGQQKLLEFAMALMSEPELLLLDEPTAGVNPTLINGLVDRLFKANEEYGITLLVIEHNMRVIMNLATRIYCLAHGTILAEGNPKQIRDNKNVINAYLGAA